MKPYWQEILDSLDYTGLDLEALNICIHDVMEPVVANEWRFDMSNWQDTDDYDLSMKAETLHACGSSACFGGHLALAQAFKKRGGEMDRVNGYPIFNQETREGAVTAFLGLKQTEFRVKGVGYLLCIPHSGLYGVVWDDDITAQHVLDRLNYIKKINFPELTDCVVVNQEKSIDQTFNEIFETE